MVKSEEGSIEDFIKVASNDAIKHLLSELIGFSMLSVMDKENTDLLDKLYFMSIVERIGLLSKSEGLTFEQGLDMSVKAKEDFSRFLKTYTKV
jgi:hypothetical protein